MTQRLRIVSDGAGRAVVTIDGVDVSQQVRSVTWRMDAGCAAIAHVTFVLAGVDVEAQVDLPAGAIPGDVPLPLDMP